MAAFRALCAALALLLALASARAAERIVAGAPHICEILFAIGAGAETVAGVDFCDWPPAANKLPRVGSYIGLNPEAVARLAPTLVLAFTEGDPALIWAREHGIKTYASHPQSLAEVLADIRTIGRLAGHARQANALAAKLAERIRALAQKAPKQRLRAFYEIWPQPLITAGGTSFISEILARAGFANIFADLKDDAPRVSLEAVIRRHPAVIIVPDEKRDIAARRRFWHRWLPDAIVLAAPHDLLHRPGPRLVDGLAWLVQQRLKLENTR